VGSKLGSRIGGHSSSRLGGRCNLIEDLLLRPKLELFHDLGVALRSGRPDQVSVLLALLRVKASCLCGFIRRRRASDRSCAVSLHCAAFRGVLASGNTLFTLD